MAQVMPSLDIIPALTQPSIIQSGNPSADRPIVPPAYPTTSPTLNLPSVPVYTPQPSPTERVISRTDSGGADELPSVGSDHRALPEAYVFKSSKLDLDLGRRLWTSRYPVYGINGVISGKAVVKKADYALNICVTLEGVCQMTVLERGMPVAEFSVPLVSQTCELWSHESGEPPQSSYDFSLSFPTYAQKSMERLPPSSYHPFLTRGYVEVKYWVRVDMTRRRFHHHETLRTRVYYLPRSFASSQFDLFGLGLRSSRLLDNDVWHSIKLLPRAPEGKRHSPYTAGFNLVSAQFALLKGQTYSASSPILFRLALRSPSPAFALLPHATVQLIKRWTFMANQVELRLSCETMLGNGEIWRTEDEEEDAEYVRTMTGCVTGGKPGGEMSWTVEGMVKVEYLIRVCVKPPKDMRSLGSALPIFLHQQVIGMATHEYTDDELVRGQPSIALTPDHTW